MKAIGLRKPRVPLEPILQLLEGSTNAKHQQVAELAGVWRRSVQRWGAIGIDVYTADRVVVALGSHPMLLWPDLWHLSDEELCA